MTRDKKPIHIFLHNIFSPKISTPESLKMDTPRAGGGDLRHASRLSSPESIERILAEVRSTLERTSVASVATMNSHRLREQQVVPLEEFFPRVEGGRNAAGVRRVDRWREEWNGVKHSARRESHNVTRENVNDSDSRRRRRQMHENAFGGINLEETLQSSPNRVRDEQSPSSIRAQDRPRQDQPRQDPSLSQSLSYTPRRQHVSVPFRQNMVPNASPSAHSPPQLDTYVRVNDRSSSSTRSRFQTSSDSRTGMFAQVPSVSAADVSVPMPRRFDRRDFLTDAELARLDFGTLVNDNHARTHAPPDLDPSLWVGNRMKSVRFSASKGINDTCPICLCDFASTDRNLMALKCKHTFHDGCIREWLKRDVRCPTCRYNVANLGYE